MSVTITDNTPAVKSGLQQKASIFLRSMADEMVYISTPKTPKKTGRLRMDILKQVLGLKGKVVWGKNYGIFQETKQFKNYSTAGTGPHFAEDSARKLPIETEKIAKRSGLI